MMERGGTTPRCPSRRLQGGDQAPVDHEVAAGGVRRPIAGQEEDEVRDLMWVGEAPGGCLGLLPAYDVSGVGARGSADCRGDSAVPEPEIGAHGSRTDRVHP